MSGFPMIALILQLALSGAAPDACNLLEPHEIARVQGEEPKEIKPSQRNEGELLIQDCVFVLPTYSKSISIEVSRGPKDQARQRWNRVFPSGGKRESISGQRNGEEREALKRQPVRGVGEKAFWVPEVPSGALYVLRKDAYFRISLGGPGTGNAKVKRAVALAQKALRRL